MKKIYIFTLSAIAFKAGYSQTTIYLENFTDQNGKGAFGGTTPRDIDVSGVNWNISFSASINLEAAPNPDYFYVTGEQFAGKDTDATAGQFSPSINIDGFINVSFSLDASTNVNNENNDRFRTGYRINGGTWTLDAINRDLRNDFNLELSQTGLTGNTLQIRINIQTNQDNDISFFDNILVVGSPPTPVRYTFTSSSWDTNPNGIATSNDDIIIASGNADISANTTYNTVTVNPGASLTVRPATTILRIAGTSSLTLESVSAKYSSLLINASVSAP